MVLGRFAAVMSGVRRVTMGRMSVVRGLLVLAFIVMLGGAAVMLGRIVVMLGRAAMMLGAFVNSHESLPTWIEQQPDSGGPP